MKSMISDRFPQWLSCQESYGNVGDVDSIPGSGSSPGGGHGYPRQYSCLKNPMDRGAWRVIVHRFTKSWTWLRRLRKCTCVHSFWYIHIIVQSFQPMQVFTTPERNQVINSHSLCPVTLGAIPKLSSKWIRSIYVIANNVGTIPGILSCHHLLLSEKSKIFYVPLYIFPICTETENLFKDLMARAFLHLRWLALLFSC